MKYTVRLDPACEEEVIIHAREHAPWVKEIEEVITRSTSELIGYGEGEIARLSGSEILCFLVEEGRVWTVTEEGRW